MIRKEEEKKRNARFLSFKKNLSRADDDSIIEMANEIPFEKQFQRILSNKSTYSPPIRSSSLTSFKQNRHKDNPVCSDYPWILQSDEKRLNQQKNLEERQKV
jgi:hypothetical protein